MANAVAELSRLINTLHEDRAKHEAAIAEIDATFASLGITAKPVVASSGRKPGRPKGKTKVTVSAPKPAGKPAAGKSGVKTRNRVKPKDGLTGEQFLYKILAEGSLNTGDVNKKWIASGRNNRADILLGQLVKAGKLKRQKVKDERGSRYTVA